MSAPATIIPRSTAAAGAGRRKLNRRAAFWVAAAVMALLLFGSAAPSPLYAVYQSAWHFSPAALTIAFGVYALALLAVLVVAGSLSDHVGRRPMIAVALLAEAAAAGVFLAAHGLTDLYGARLLQGIATGSASGALGAALVELQPTDRPALAPTVNSAAPTFGLAVGALGASVLVQYGPAPTELVYWVLLAASIVGLAVLAFMPETGTRRAGAVRSLAPSIGVPSAARRVFVSAVPSLIAVWALGGLYLSLGPSLASDLVGSADYLWGGVVIFLLTGTGSAAAIGLRRLAAPTAMVNGNAVLAIGAAATLVAIVAHSAGGFLAGTAIAGVGFGLAFLGAFRTLSALAQPHERAALITTIYVVSYLAFSLPVIAAGIATTHLGLHTTAVVYGAAVTALSALAALAGRTTKDGGPAAA